MASYFNSKISSLGNSRTTIWDKQTLLKHRLICEQRRGATLLQERESLGRTVVVLHWLQASGQLFVFFFFLMGFASCSVMCWRRQWYPTPVLLPGKSHGYRSLEGCSPWGR